MYHGQDRDAREYVRQVLAGTDADLATVDIAALTDKLREANNWSWNLALMDTDTFWRVVEGHFA